jgi:hypothetical protein
VSGTFEIRTGHIENIDLSGSGDVEAGKALAQAIREYVKAYP